MFRLFIVLEDRELALDIYFKKQDIGSRWMLQHHVLIAEIVWQLLKTRDFQLDVRRIR
jgi:hypothetical protein